MKVAFLTDEHVPYQDDRARQVALKVLEDFKPDAVVTGSDGLDFYSLSVFDKNPERAKLNLQVEIDKWQAVQDEWNSVIHGAKKYYIYGNHEDRLRRYLWRHPEVGILNAMRLESLLGLDWMGFDYDAIYGSNEVNFYNRLVVKHGKLVRKGSGQSARAELENERYAVSIMSGHTHRLGSVFSQTRSGVVEAHECGCLCLTETEYIKRPDWQQGFGLAEVTENSLSVELIKIEPTLPRYKAIWRGKEYQGA